MMQSLLLNGLRAVLDMHCGTTLHSGPYSGVKLEVLASRTLGYWTKRLGVYESDLATLLCSRASLGGTLIDVGAGEGYHAVSLLTRFPKLKAVTFEQDQVARTLLHANARANNVRDRLLSDARCTDGILACAIARHPDAWLLIDVEGYERSLLDPVLIPSLARHDIFIEIHDFASPGTGALLQSRFEASHYVDRLDARRLSVSQLPTLLSRACARLSDTLGHELCNERPDDMYWLCCRARREW